MLLGSRHGCRYKASSRKHTRDLAEPPEPRILSRVNIAAGVRSLGPSWAGIARAV